jgi:ankyrin repeat protein
MKKESIMSKELHHLFQAIKEHRLEQVKAAIKNDQSLVNLKDDKGNIALIVAAEYGTTGIIDYLLKHDAHINYQLPPHHYTPLIVGIRAGRKDIVKYLLESGADINKVDDQDRNALWHAQQSQQQEIIDLLQKK